MAEMSLNEPSNGPRVNGVAVRSKIKVREPRMVADKKREMRYKTEEC